VRPAIEWIGPVVGFTIIFLSGAFSAAIDILPILKIHITTDIFRVV